MRVVVRARRVRTVLAVLAVLLPHRARRMIYRRLLGHEIADDATIGRSLIDVARLRVASGATIGSLTMIRGCEDVELAEGASIGSLVFVNAVPTGSRYFAGQDRHPALVLGRGAVISGLHLIDACDRVSLGDFADVGGMGSQILTHSIDLVRMRQSAQPVSIGHHCLVGTRSVLLPGTDLPECSVLTAGSVMGPEAVQDGYRLYSGAPATAGRTLNPRIPFFHHTMADIL
jgi:acetyltransferase-like isoleucine patch superfamily enzyme